MIRHISRAILLIAAFFVAQTASAQNWRGEIYGGGVFERSEDYGGTSFDLDTGTAYGLGVYNTALIPGIEVGLDLMWTEADYSTFDSGVDSTSLMAVGRWDTSLAPGTTLYVGAGLGAIQVEFDGGTAFPAASGDDTVFGGQISLGVRYAVGAGQIFGELKHQRAFDDAVILGTVQTYKSTSALVGFRFSF